MTAHPQVHSEVLVPPFGKYRRPVAAYVLDMQRGGGRTPHKHPRGQFLAVTAGSIAVTVVGGTFVAPPDRAVWVPARTVHATRHMASTRLRTFYIAPFAATALPDRTTVMQMSPLLRELIDMFVTFPRLYDERGAQGRLAAVLLDQIARATTLPLQIAMPKSPALLMLANRLLDAPADRRSLVSLASSSGISLRTLERQFKAETGLPLRSFRRQAKLFRALELLASGWSVSSVSDELGFGEPSAFIAMFRSALGTTPRRYLNSVPPRSGS